MNNGLNDILMMISICSGIIALIVGSRIRGLLWYYAWASFSADIIGLALLTLAIPRYWNSNLFMLLEFLLVSFYLIRQSINGAKQIRARFAIYVIALFFIANTIWKSVLQLNYADGAIFCAIFILLLIWAFYKVIRDVEVLRIERSPLFIFCSGFLIYVAGTIVIMLARKYLDMHDLVLKGRLRDAHHVLNTLKNVTVAYSLHLHEKYGPKQ